jgi:hypothetical protein
MRVETVLTIKLDAQEAERLTPLAAELVSGARFTAGSYQVRFHHAADAARRFIGVLDEIDVDYGIHEERTFSADEIERAPALHVARTSPVGVATPLPEGECPHRQAETGPDHAPPPRLDEVPDSFARTATGSLMVDEPLAATLIRKHITGCLLRPLREKAGGLSRWFELVPIHRLPPMHSPPTRFIHEPERACPECGQGGIILQSLPFYDVDVEKIADVNLSFEQFGVDGEIMPELVVSQRLFRVLRDHGVEDLMVQPVAFV